MTTVAESKEKTSGSKRPQVMIAVASVVTVFVAWVSIAVGAYYIPLPDVLSVLAAKAGMNTDPSKVHATVVWDIRLVRVLLALSVGAALATSGAAFQSAFRNPLVEPFILGVSAGAAFGAGLSIIFDIPVPIQVLAFGGGAMAVALSHWLSRVKGQRSTVTLVLSGIVVGSFFSAVFAFFQYVGTDEQLRRLVFWIMGGFYRSTWEDVMVVLPLTAVGVAVLIVMAWRLNIVTLGDADCRSLGINPGRTRMIVIVAATVLTAAAVSVAGIVAWVGLLIPHAARLLVGPDNRFVIPLSAALGATFLMVCDMLARTVHTGELPIGILTSLLGAPFVAFLIRRSKNLGWS